MLNADPLTTPLATAVVDDDPDLRGHLADLLGTQPATFATIEALEEHMIPGEPLLVIVGPSYSDSVGLARVERKLKRRPRPSVARAPWPPLSRAARSARRRPRSALARL